MRAVSFVAALTLVDAARTLRSGAKSEFLRPQGAETQRLINHQNMQYSAEFTIGGQPILGIMDTGSFELLVRSTRCAACAHPTPPYDHVKSKSYVKNGTSVQHVFGSGPCVSMMGYDEVCIGKMCSPRQAFWEITAHQIPVLDQAKFAAIVGVGPQFGFGNQEKTLLMSFGIEEFSVCLRRESGADGVLTWGAIASEETKAVDFRTVPSIGEFHWTTRMNQVYFGNDPSKVAPICPPGQKCAAIIDSGTSLIAAPYEHLVALSSHIPPIAEDCSNLHELPTMHFSLEGKDYTLPPSAYVMRVKGGMLQAKNVWDVLFFKPKIRKMNTCMPAFMTMNFEEEHGPMWIMGMPFFRYYHSSFNRAKREMHFATAGPTCEPMPFELPKKNGTAFLDTRGKDHADFQPFDVDLSLLVPPTLSSMIDTSKSKKIVV
jgi:hypothetical protein